jgi:U1 small nuclear ribonucleoprotein
MPQDDYKPVIQEVPKERRKRVAEKRKRDRESKLAEEKETYNPAENEDATEDAFKTLFIGRLSYAVDERKLKREMERYGPVKKLRIVNDQETGKPRGYAFVEFEDERDMKTAYKQADGQKIEDRRIVVDVERGRTVKGWAPRRLGGGLGGTRLGGKSKNQHHSGREGAAGGGGSSGGSGYRGAAPGAGGSSYGSPRGDYRADRGRDVRPDDRRRPDDRSDPRRRDDRRDDRPRDRREEPRDRDRQAHHPSSCSAASCARLATSWVWSRC